MIDDAAHRRIFVWCSLSSSIPRSVGGSREFHHIHIVMGVGSKTKKKNKQSKAKDSTYREMLGRASNGKLGLLVKMGG